jgi:EAL domain-containing protein (putative c-di-GMP-specific phosphodiesterase class I)/GGDEF domain-containing protein
MRSKGKYVMLNHRLFIEKANRIFDLCGDAGSVLLCYMDLANFKLVNYCYGLERGSQLLQAVADYLQRLPQVAHYERVFSDQFVFITFSEKQQTDEEIIAAYDRFTEDFLLEQQDRYPACDLKFHCGISRVTKRKVMEAIDLANMARMDAKKANAPTAVLYTEAQLQRLAEQKWREKEIMLALHEKRFTFFLQPKVNLLTGEILGAEALVRRLNPDGTVVCPDTFVPIMEENGSIVALDFLVYEQVCKYLQDRAEQRLPRVRVSVNLSRLHVRNLKTAERLHKLAEQYQIPPELLEFELTESILLNEFDEAKNMVDELRSYGYRVSIDDFGSGYTGINIFQEFNFDVLKLDRKFLSDDAKIKARNSAIIPSILNIAKELGIFVICEGVEREDQCRYLIDLGCRGAQGFYFSKAVPPDEFYQIFQRQRGYYPLQFQERDEERGLHGLQARAK